MMTCFVVEYAPRRLIPTLIREQHVPLKASLSRSGIFASAMEENHEQCRAKYCLVQSFAIHGLTCASACVCACVNVQCVCSFVNVQLLMFNAQRV